MDPLSDPYSPPCHRQKTGRKTWKSLKEKREAVWPDFLENALLEALERYRPTSSKDPRLLRRFPKRNAFISNYIKQKTGKSRTPKQVGSRLQQLRETCTEERVIRLICSRDFDAPDRIAASQAPSRIIPESRSATATATPSSSGLAPSMSVESLTLVDPYDYPIGHYSDDVENRSGQSLADDHSWPRAYVHIDLVPSGDHYASSTHDYTPASFTLDLDESSLTDTHVLAGSEAWKWQRRISVPISLPACYYAPSVVVSSTLLSAQGLYESVFRVQRDHKIVFEESTDLERVSEGPTRPVLFRTTLLPKFWGSVAAKISDLRQCVVIQDIYDCRRTTRSGEPIYSIIYNFDGSLSLDAPQSPYFPSYASPYHSSPIHEERIPLAPILTNAAVGCHPSITTDALGLHYDYDSVSGAADLHVPLLPSLSTLVPELHQAPAQWLSPIYLANGYYPATSYAMAQESAGVFMDNETLAYQGLYPY